MVRKKLGFENELRIPIVELLDVFSVVLNNFNYEIVSDHELPADRHAETEIMSGTIRIKESIYERACNGEGRDRMTVAHEIAHYLMLRVFGFKLYRNVGKREIKSFESPEWQAKCFAGEFMISHALTAAMEPEEIADKCGVSFEAALYQHDHR
jgi:Zn-dependent peptidase ImmA (M78 family)